MLMALAPLKNTWDYEGLRPYVKKMLLGTWLISGIMPCIKYF